MDRARIYDHVIKLVEFHPDLRRVKTVTYKYKRVFDFVGALLLLLICSPLLVIVGICLFVAEGRPILFRHKRIGRGGEIFFCLKFRTMITSGDQCLRDYLQSHPAAVAEWIATRKLRNDPRVTKIGAILRRWSLDELPQLINVLRGEMSLVGPRPIVGDEVGYYGEKIVEYERVRPGLTGLWQISGRNDVSYEARVSLDCEYVSTISIRNDLRILLQTVPALLRSNGAY